MPRNTPIEIPRAHFIKLLLVTAFVTNILATRTSVAQPIPPTVYPNGVIEGPVSAGASRNSTVAVDRFGRFVIAYEVPGEISGGKVLVQRFIGNGFALFGPAFLSDPTQDKTVSHLSIAMNGGISSSTTVGVALIGGPRIPITMNPQRVCTQLIGYSFASSSCPIPLRSAGWGTDDPGRSPFHRRHRARIV